MELGLAEKVDALQSLLALKTHDNAPDILR
jgi:hypothetical protein